ncbi:MAG: translation initiation factor IF-1 [Candidatus Omnitrophica bacterium]|nr:translation initiation factor IF-1 [Candidatus Omnitrophota bacterium]
MPKEEAIGVEGRVLERLSNGRFRIELKGGHLVLAYVAGKMQRQTRRILEGDTVGLMLSPYDLTQGRIVYLART